MGIGLFCKKHNEYSQSGECRWCEPAPPGARFKQPIVMGNKPGVEYAPAPVAPWYAQIAASGTASLPAYYIDQAACQHTEWQPAVNMDAETCKACGWLRPNVQKARKTPVLQYGTSGLFTSGLFTCKCGQCAATADATPWYSGGWRHAPSECRKVGE